MQGLHLNLESHFLKIIPSNWSILKNNPDILISLEPKFFNYLTSKYFAHHYERFKLPNVNVSSTISDQSYELGIFGKAAMLILAWNLDR